MNKLHKILKNDYLLFLIRIVVGVLFLFTGLEKITNVPGFAESILNYHMLPPALANIVAISLSWIEFTTGLFVLFGINTKESSLIIISLLCIFTMAVIVALILGLNIDCGCFGTITAEKVGLRKIFENLFILLLVFILLYNGPGKFNIYGQLNKVN